MGMAWESYEKLPIRGVPLLGVPGITGDSLLALSKIPRINSYPKPPLLSKHMVTKMKLAEK